MSQPRTDPEAATLDGLRILARLVAEAWRAGGLPPAASEAERRRQRRLQGAAPTDCVVPKC